MELISLIVPCYNEEGSLPLFYQTVDELSKKMNTVDFEFVFVDDGSRDKTCQILRELNKKDPRVRYISFSRNFGKEAAMYAGFEACKGDYAVSVDADLQHPPALIEGMYRSIKEEGYDCVAARRFDRKGEPLFKRLFSAAFYKVINGMSETKLVSGATDFRLMKRRMVDAVLALSEKRRFSKGIFDWVGFQTKWIGFENVERAAGSSKWSFKKLFQYSLEGILSFSTAPLAFALYSGILSLLAAFVLLIVILCTLPSSTAAIVSDVVLWMGGLNLLAMGISGMYQSKSYSELKNRPIYIARETEEDNQ